MSKFTTGSLVTLRNDVYKTAFTGTLVLNPDSFYQTVREGVYDVWTIRRADGTKYRGEGYLSEPTYLSKYPRPRGAEPPC